jgi:pimeloyl-ACP methyl ester carboxylesterase
MNLSVQAQQWLDTTLYPFENKFIQLDAGQMHYVDEGEGDIILFVHGTPAWSFLYREYIADLSKKYRCIAIDHIGFGLSEKPEKFDGKPQSHSKNLTEFIEKLDLKEITFVVHDFGGPIGLSSAIQNHTRIRQVVMFNTWLWATKDDPAAQKVNKIINSGIAEFLYLRMNFSPKFLLKKGFHEKKNLSKRVHKQYIHPFPNKSARLSLLNIGKSLVGSSDWYQEQWENLDKLEQKPWLILWGTKDEFITLKFLQKWKKRIPNAKVKTFDCGHFVQEEKTKETIQEIEKFMKMGH